MHRVQGEKSGNEDTAPLSCGNPIQEQEEQERVGNVKEEIGKVMTSRVQAIEVIIYHVGNPGKGMPTTKVTRSESPTDTVPGHPDLNMKVLGDVIVVIKVDELVMGNGPIAEQRNEG